jgi:hypothetical protein
MKPTLELLILFVVLWLACAGLFLFGFIAGCRRQNTQPVEAKAARILKRSKTNDKSLPVVPPQEADEQSRDINNFYQ